MELLYNLSLFLFSIALLLLPVALYKPKLFTRFLKENSTRPKLSLILIGAVIVFAVISDAAMPESARLAREEKRQQEIALQQQLDNESEAKRQSEAEEEAKRERELQEAKERERLEEAERQAQLYEVVSIVDGDTIKVSYEGKVESVRLVGIDTPETVHPSKPVECFGKEASAYMVRLVSGQSVRLEEDSSQSSRDRYDRLLRFIHLEDGTNVNEKMVRDGYAFEYTYQSNPYKYQDLFRSAEREARENKRGLWASNTCNGEQTPVSTIQQTTTSSTSSSTQSSAPATSPAPAPSSTGVVKKSTSDICHAPGTTYYSRTKNFIPYDTLQQCLDSGGRLPLR